MCSKLLGYNKNTVSQVYVNTEDRISDFAKYTPTK